MEGADGLWLRAKNAIIKSNSSYVTLAVNRRLIFCERNGMVGTKNKTIELWDGYSVDVNEQFFDDVDFLSDFSKAMHNNDLEEVLTMLFAVVGGEKVYDDARTHIEKQYGYFSMKELRKISSKIEECFPKAGNRASRRQSWTRK